MGVRILGRRSAKLGRTAGIVTGMAHHGFAGKRCFLTGAASGIGRATALKLAGEGADALQLMTAHAAKGLEFDVVFVTGLEEGLFPHDNSANDPGGVEEERRLMYVGMTRARRELRLSWAGARTPGARASRRPSRFLDGTTSVLGDGARAARRPSRAASKGSSRGPALPAKCRGCGAELVTAAQRKTGRCDECPPSYNEATFERLREWRLATARAASVPAYVVFTDATLTAIAEAEPSHESELSQIAGVGARKLGLYGAQVLGILQGADVAEVLENASAATKSDA